ncbi:MAG: TonB-dependent receptor [Flavobacteriaceae bacterium]|nr:TonB-dependent receptor [Flavobacteriaceae bacterium]
MKVRKPCRNQSLKTFGGKVVFMISKKILSAAFLFAFLISFSQNRETDIDTVYLFDSQINKIRKFQEITEFSDEDFQKNSSNLSEILRFQTPIYIKENGRGSVASPEFRGTTAQQTAFVWNGIGVNSVFLGQADVNNLGIFTADYLDVKSGGGSVVYGSGAIGGSVHFNNILKFNDGFKTSVFSETASFGTFNNVLKTSFSNRIFSVKLAASFIKSKNDYEVKEKNYINRNGEYENTNFHISTAFKIAPHQQISWITEFYDGLQHYPILEEGINKTKYETQNVRSLISWDWTKTFLQNSFKMAYTEENYQYFGDLEKPETNGGIGKNLIIKDDFNYFFNPKWNANLLTEFQNNRGETYSVETAEGIGNVSRNVFSVAGLLRYFANENLKFEAGIKKDFVEDIGSPFLFSFSGKFAASKHYELGLNISRNFRFPSYNDLYWSPGGNTDLKAETSYQFELRNQFAFGDFKFSAIPYYMDITDLIRWLPTAFGYWAAFNTKNVESYGLETQFSFEKKIGENALKSALGYSFTKSTDLETGKQLMYVPQHKFFGNIDYQYRFLKIYVQGIFNGETFTSSDENTNTSLKHYFIMNCGVSVSVFKNYTFGFKANNIFDQIYFTTESYPLPKRNYSVYFNLNI